MESLIEKVDNVSIVRIKYDSLDANSTEQFKKEISPIIDKNINIIFDMSNVNFIDSSGCGSLLSCLRSVNKQGGDLKLYGVQHQVQMVFELIRLHRIIEIFGNKKEAIKSFK
jgi:anti-sigma B factor antagonist